MSLAQGEACEKEFGPLRKHVVSALIVRPGFQSFNPRVLMTQRNEQQSYPLLWELPGGKKERGETGPQALHRELKEELGIDAKIGRWLKTTLVNNEYEVELYLVTEFSGEPQCLVEQRDMEWVPAMELGDYNHMPSQPVDFMKLAAQEPFKA
jgi:8-oxo-dGTP diphosphatase